MIILIMQPQGMFRDRSIQQGNLKFGSEERNFRDPRNVPNNLLSFISFKTYSPISLGQENPNLEEITNLRQRPYKLRQK